MNSKLLANTYFLLFFISVHLCSAAQTDTAKFRVSYMVSHLLDTTNEQSRINYELYLFIGATTSLSESKNKFHNDSISAVYEQMAQNSTIININTSSAPPKHLSAFESLITHKDFKEGMFTDIGQIALDRYVMEESINPITWNQKNEYTIIKGKKSQLAECFYRGRPWKVWFTTEIALSEGPWKLYGLPGLILKAQDIKNEISFDFIDIVKIGDNEAVTINKNKTTKITHRQFMNLLKAYAGNPMQYFQNQTGIPFDFKEFNQNSAGSQRMKAPNNPIDLTW